jgi:hypothetical protein
MMRGGTVFALAIALAGCGQKAEQPRENQASAEQKKAVASEAAPAVEANAAGASSNAGAAAAPAGNQLGTLPPANAALRFVGTWAANQASCASKPWRFTAKELTATDGPHCTFYKVSKIAGGYDIAAECPTKEPVHTDLIKLRFAESARAMLVESNAISPMGLVYCGK